MDKNKFYSYMFGISLGCAIVGTIFSVLMLISNSKSSEQIEKEKFQNFYDKCASACAPSGVYSISYNKCACSAIVVYKDIK
jgi:hypothetical protein